jgi:hypothetical protein
LSNQIYLRRFTQASVTLAIFVSFVSEASAFERVTLRNGFEVNCDHHAQVEGHTRLFLSREEDNYIEFTPAEIATVEPMPDPPASEQAKVPSSVRSAATDSAEAKLSPSDLHEMLSTAGQEHHLDVDLLASLVKAESGGNARAVSRAGARGLMQLMPETASNLGVQDSFKPEQNLRGGSTYLDALLIRYHENLALALAAYNAGPAAVDKYHGIPPYRETRAYVARVIHEFNRRVLAREAEARKSTPPMPQGKSSR